MKNIYLFISLCFLLFACNSETEKIEAKFEDGTTKIIATYKGDQVIKRTEYYPDGKPKITGQYDDNGLRQGHWQFWYENGNLWSECDYKAGLRHGTSIVYYENGNKQYEGTFDNDKKTGVWKFWNNDGSLAKELQQ